MALFVGIDGRLSIGYDEAPAGTFTTSEDFTDVGGVHTTYQIDTTTKRMWDPATPVLVYVDAVLQSTGFVVYRAGGIIVFDTPLGGAQVVTASGKYIAMTEIAIAKNLTLDVTMNIEDVTTFDTSTKDSDRWGANFALLGAASGTIDVLFDTDVTFWHNALFSDVTYDSGYPIAITFMQPGYFAFYLLGHITGVSQTSNASGVPTETINFALASDPPYFLQL